MYVCMLKDKSLNLMKWILYLNRIYFHSTLFLFNEFKIIIMKKWIRWKSRIDERVRLNKKKIMMESFTWKWLWTIIISNIIRVQFLKHYWVAPNWSSVHLLLYLDSGKKGEIDILCTRGYTNGIVIMLIPSNGEFPFRRIFSICE